MINIDKAVNKFIKRDLKGKTDLQSIVSYLNTNGYTVKLYQDEEEDALISLYDLNNKTKDIHAFTVVENNSKTVYLNDALPAENKKYSILHETAHIALGHLYSENIAVNDRLCEMQAEAFAYKLLTYKKTNNIIVVACIAIVSLLALYFFSNLSLVSNSQYKVLNINDNSDKTESVYVTKSGSKYHKYGCSSIKGREVMKISIQDAQKKYSPCLICNP